MENARNFSKDVMMCIECKEVWHCDFLSLWFDGFSLSFIENYGTHIVTSATIGGRDVVYVRQHQSSPLSVSDIESYVKDIEDQRFSDSKVNTNTGSLKYKDKVSEAGKKIVVQLM